MSSFLLQRGQIMKKKFSCKSDFDCLNLRLTFLLNWKLIKTKLIERAKVSSKLVSKDICQTR